MRKSGLRQGRQALTIPRHISACVQIAAGTSSPNNVNILIHLFRISGLTGQITKTDANELWEPYQINNDNAIHESVSCNVVAIVEITHKPPKRNMPTTASFVDTLI